MKRSWFLILTLAAFAGLTTSAWAAARKPIELIRELRALQEGLAMGESNAHLTQRELMTSIGLQLGAAEAEASSQPQNLRAAILYLLSGGEADAARELLKSGSLQPEYAELLKGALAYADGRYVEAASYLDLDARTLEPGLAGAVALVQGVIATKTHPQRAMQFFDHARLLSPGTLVEEAALRRQILLLGVADRKKFGFLLWRYIRRFGRSYYADAFLEQLSAKFAEHDDAALELQILDTFLSQLDAAKQRAFYLRLARAAIAKGKMKLARFAADRVLVLAKRGSQEEKSARIFKAAATTVTADVDEALSELTEIPAEDLDGEQRSLLRAAISVAQHIRRRPAEVAKASRSEQKGAGAAHMPELSVVGQQTLQRAKALLVSVDAALREVRN